MSVIVLNSHVARGSVGGRASTFVLEHAGLPVVAVPTVILPWHPGQGPGTRTVPVAFDALVADLAAAPWLGSVAALLSGYLGHADQAAAIARLVDALKAVNPDAVYLCDPVMGDDNRLYVPAATAAAIRTELLPRADIATPNASELAWLTGHEIRDRRSAVVAARALGVAEVVATSVPGGPPGTTGVALISRDEVVTAHHDVAPRVPHGTGDTFAGLYLANRLKRQTPAVSLERALGGTVAMALAASRLGVDELPLAQQAEALTAPPPVSVRTDKQPPV